MTTPSKFFFFPHTKRKFSRSARVSYCAFIALLMMIRLITAADELTKKFGVTPKTAHFLRWQHQLRWLVNHNYVEIIFVGTKEQVADILTKVVDISTFLAVCRILFKRGSKAVLPH